MKRVILSSFLVIILGACATWVPVHGKYVMKSQNFEVELPSGWHRAARVKNYLLITRDGLPLQQIIIERININKDLEYTKKKFRKGMLPQEVAEVVIDNSRFNPAVMNLEVLENIPYTVGGFPGFKLVYVYRDEQGLRRKGIIYGFIFNEWYYGIKYEAPLRYYFDKDIGTFQKVCESFKVIQKP